MTALDQLSPKRWRAGRIERLCIRSGVWYAALVGHIHRYHRSRCRCVAVCGPLLAAGKVVRA